MIIHKYQTQSNTLNAIKKKSAQAGSVNKALMKRNWNCSAFVSFQCLKVRWPIILLTTLALATIISGCSLAPPNILPTPPIAKTYPAEYEPVMEGKSAVTREWREFFTDPCIQDLISRALDNNRSLRIAIQRVAEARALYGIQRADLFPNIGAATSGQRGRTPADLSVTGEAVTASQYQTTLNLLSFELDFWGRVRNLSDAALSGYLATEEAKRSFTLGLIAEVANTYLSEREFDERIALAQKTLAGREDSYRIAKRKFEVGYTSELDARQAETLLTRARSDLASLSLARAQIHNALRVLVGTDLNNLPSPASLSDQKLDFDIPAGLPSDLLINRPDVLAAENRLKAANANIGAARAAFLPRIQLTGAFGTASAQLDGLFEAGSKTWNFLPVITLPLFDAGRNKSGLDIAQARKNIAVADYELTLQQAFREVSDSLAARKQLMFKVQAQSDTLSAESARTRIVNLRYTNGAANYLELLDAQRDLFSAEQQMVQTQREQLTNAILLYKALGGGILKNNTYNLN
ncbi:MAG: efflux transporter outer membrane subunit [Desulfobacterales bacterium]